LRTLDRTTAVCMLPLIHNREAQMGNCILGMGIGSLHAAARDRPKMRTTGATHGVRPRALLCGAAP